MNKVTIIYFRDAALMFLFLLLALVNPINANAQAATMMSDVYLHLHIIHFGNFTSNNAFHDANMSDKVFVGTSSTPMGSGAVTIPLILNNEYIIDSFSSGDVPGLHVSRQKNFVRISAIGFNDEKSRESVKADFRFTGAKVLTIKNDLLRPYENPNNGSCGIDINNTKNSDQKNDQYSFSENGGRICSTTSKGADILEVHYTPEITTGTPACHTNSDCGTNSFVGGPFCTGNNVFRNFITHTCNHPGTAQAFCSHLTTNQFQNACSSNQTCSGGSCINITTQTPACHTNSDCGTNSFVGGPFCTGNNVFRNFITHTCNHPGTAQAFCSHLTTNQFQNACSSNQTCSGGSCINITTQTPACHTNSDCGTNSFVGGPFCTGNNVFRNFITHTCNHPGTAQAFCSHLTTNQFQNACSSNQTCSGGSCINITTQTPACHTNSDCGTNSFVGGPFCTGNNVSETLLPTLAIIRAPLKRSAVI